MRATYIPIQPTATTNTPSVEPEKLAACLARYSRSQEGAQSLLEKYADQTPDAIFKFVDYGHASIAGLTGGIALALDGATMLTAYKLFEFAQMADGQESSTRYISISVESLPNPTDLGINPSLHPLWLETNQLAFELYQQTSAQLEEDVQENPAVARIPEGTKPKVAERMLKNYALDRCRYFLPLTCKTNIAIVASARIWADTLRLLGACPWLETQQAAHLLREQLKLVAPNLIRHSYPDEAAHAFVNGAFTHSQTPITNQADCQAILYALNTPSVFCQPGSLPPFTGKTNRYSHVGAAIKRRTVQVQWSAIALAELRDLNRHRTGFRFSSFQPVGFYLPEETRRVVDAQAFSTFLSQSQELLAQLQATNPGQEALGFFLGTQVPFEHTQQADKFLYEVELRTGLGAHFRYAEHLRQAAELYFAQFPEDRPFIQIGEAEPEGV